MKSRIKATSAFILFPQLWSWNKNAQLQTLLFPLVLILHPQLYKKKREEKMGISQETKKQNRVRKLSQYTSKTKSKPKSK